MLIFKQILEKGIATDILPGRTLFARDWYRDAASQIAANRVGPNRMQKGFEQKRKVNRLELGTMYMFLYDPKTKKDLGNIKKMLKFTINCNEDISENIKKYNLLKLNKKSENELFSVAFLGIIDDKFSSSNLIFVDTAIRRKCISKISGILKNPMDTAFSKFRYMSYSKYYNEVVTGILTKYLFGLCVDLPITYPLVIIIYYTILLNKFRIVRRNSGYL
jgi:hypothetical protein